MEKKHNILFLIKLAAESVSIKTTYDRIGLFKYIKIKMECE